MEELKASEAQKEYYSSLKGKLIKSRGVPADEQLRLPRHDEVRDVLGINADPFEEFGADWGIEGVMQFVFPKKYQETYYEVATSFIKELLQHPEGMYSEMTGEWIRKNKISKATFYNKIVPRLKRIGMITAEREAGQKGAGYILKPSLTFHNYLFKMAKEWQRIVKTARAKAPARE